MAFSEIPYPVLHVSILGLFTLLNEVVYLVKLSRTVDLNYSTKNGLVIPKILMVD